MSPRPRVLKDEERLVTRAEMERAINEALARYHERYTSRLTPAKVWLWPVRAIAQGLKDFAQTMLGLALALWRRARYGTPVLPEGR